MLPTGVQPLAEILIDYKKSYDQLHHLIVLLSYLLKSISPPELHNADLVDLLEYHRHRFRNWQGLVEARRTRNQTEHARPLIDFSKEELTEEEIFRQIPVVVHAIQDVLPECPSKLRDEVAGKSHTGVRTIDDVPINRSEQRRARHRRMSAQDRLDWISRRAREHGAATFNEE